MHDDYMDTILLQKGYKQIDDSLRPEVLKEFWERLKPSLQLEVEAWNALCSRYGAGNTKLAFYTTPFMIDGLKSIAELSESSPAAEHLREWQSAPSFPGAPMWSVCAETVRKGVRGEPAARLYVWLTQSEPQRLQYSYGETCPPNGVELPLRFEAGALVFGDGEDESSFVKRWVRLILQPLLEQA
jgi:hypothetical protein